MHTYTIQAQAYFEILCVSMLAVRNLDYILILWTRANVHKTLLLGFQPRSENLLQNSVSVYLDVLLAMGAAAYNKFAQWRRTAGSSNTHKTNKCRGAFKRKVSSVFGKTKMTSLRCADRNVSLHVCCVFCCAISNQYNPVSPIIHTQCILY